MRKPQRRRQTYGLFVNVPWVQSISEHAINRHDSLRFRIRMKRLEARESPSAPQLLKGESAPAHTHVAHPTTSRAPGDHEFLRIHPHRGRLCELRVQARLNPRKRRFDVLDDIVARLRCELSVRRRDDYEARGKGVLCSVGLNVMSAKSPRRGC